VFEVSGFRHLGIKIIKILSHLMLLKQDIFENIMKKGTFAPKWQILIFFNISQALPIDILLY